MCSELQMFNQFKLHIKMNFKALFVSWFYLKRRINVSSKVSSEILNLGWCSSVPNVKRPMQKSSYVLRSYVGISKEMKIVENYEMKLNALNSPGSPG